MKKWESIWTRNRKHELIIKKPKETQIQLPTKTTIFFPRVVNNIKIDFTEKEISLLSRGLKYN